MLTRWRFPASVFPDVPRSHVHAALSRWFDNPAGSRQDLCRPDHHDDDKPYRIVGFSRTAAGPVLDLTTLNLWAAERLAQSAADGATLRFGSRHVSLGRPHEVIAVPWEALAVHHDERTWELDILTPATFRSGQVTKVLPEPATVLRGLSVTWGRFSGLGRLRLPRDQADSVWVTRLMTRSTRERVGSAWWPGIVGTVRYECADPVIASQVGPLFHLAPYAGIGSGRPRGLGQVVLRSTRPEQQQAHPRGEARRGPAR